MSDGNVGEVSLRYYFNMNLKQGSKLCKHKEEEHSRMKGEQAEAFLASSRSLCTCNGMSEGEEQEMGIRRGHKDVN